MLDDDFFEEHFTIELHGETFVINGAFLQGMMDASLGIDQCRQQSLADVNSWHEGFSVQNNLEASFGNNPTEVLWVYVHPLNADDFKERDFRFPLMATSNHMAETMAKALNHYFPEHNTSYQTFTRNNHQSGKKWVRAIHKTAP